MGAQNNCLDETVVLNTQNMLTLMFKKIIIIFLLSLFAYLGSCSHINETMNRVKTPDKSVY